MTEPRDPEVLVVGAGPVGLMAALFLQRQGVAVTVLDQVHRTNEHSYALAVHPQTLDLLEEAGVSGPLLARGRRVATVAFYEGRERRAEVDLAAGGGAHPFVLMMRLNQLERAIEDHLQRKGQKVLWNHRLQGLREEGGRMVAEVGQLDQVAAGYPIARTEWVVVKTHTLRPRYVIGADGWDSTVRKLVGIDMESSGPGQIVSVFEMDAKGELPAEGRMVLEGSRLSVYWPLEEGRCRWAFQVGSAAEHNPGMDTLKRLLAERAPWFEAEPSYIYWSTLGQFDRRTAREFGRGGVVLAGDAAHLATPAGARSMNLGLAEAWAMAGRIADVLRRGMPEGSVLQEAAARRDRWMRRAGSARTQTTPGVTPWVARNADRIVDCMPLSGTGLDAALLTLGLSLTAAS
jgi:2-polyprenyl-6-methoxyphenol hydroxylase-like FAD-dependent oxidoreductase